MIIERVNDVFTPKTARRGFEGSRRTRKWLRLHTRVWHSLHSIFLPYSNAPRFGKASEKCRTILGILPLELAHDLEIEELTPSKFLRGTCTVFADKRASIRPLFTEMLTLLQGISVKVWRHATDLWALEELHGFTEQHRSPSWCKSCWGVWSKVIEMKKNTTRWNSRMLITWCARLRASNISPAFPIRERTSQVSTLSLSHRSSLSLPINVVSLLVLNLGIRSCSTLDKKKKNHFRRERLPTHNLSRRKPPKSNLSWNMPSAERERGATTIAISTSQIDAPPSIMINHESRSIGLSPWFKVDWTPSVSANFTS